MSPDSFCCSPAIPTPDASSPPRAPAPRILSCARPPDRTTPENDACHAPECIKVYDIAWFFSVSSLLLFLLSCPALVMAGPAEPRLIWLSTRSEHFVVHYPETRGDPADAHAVTSARLARRTADMAEQIYAKLSQSLQHPLPSPVHLVLDAHLDQAGSKTDPEMLRIELETRPPTALAAVGRGDWLKESIAHELSHVAMATAGSPIPPGRVGMLELRLGDRGWFNRLAGEPLPANPELGLNAKIPLTDPTPFFWAEGSAEYLAELAGANRWDAGRDMLLRTATLENLVLSKAALLGGLGKQGLERSRAYNQGYSFLLFLRERYGEEAFGRVVDASRRRMRWDWTDTLEAAQGLSFEALYGRWRNWLEERYGNLLAMRSQEVAGEPLSLTVPAWRSADGEVRRRWYAQPVEVRRAQREGSGQASAWPAWSKDGKFLAFWENGLKVRSEPETSWPAFGGRPLEAFRDRLELSRRERRVGYLPGVRQYPLSWSPDGKRLVVVAQEGWRLAGPQRTEGFGWNALYLVDVSETARDGVRLSVAPPGLPIPNTLRAQDPAWAPDGTWIAFVRYLEGTGNLWIVRPDGSEPRQLTSFADGTEVARPAWSPDSRSLVFEVFRRNQRDLWTLSLITRELAPVMLDAFDDRDPCWAADGKIYYSSDLTGSYNLFTFDPTTSEVRRLTEVLGGAFMPELTPKGNLAFVYFDGYAFRLHGMLASKAADLAADNASYFVDPSLAQGILQGSLEAPAAEGVSYRAFRGAARPELTPSLLLTEKDVLGGGQLEWRDALERHTVHLEALLGTGSILEFRYTNARLNPHLSLGGWRAGVQETVGLQPLTPEEGAVRELRRPQVQGLVWAGLSAPMGSRLFFELTVDHRTLAFRGEHAGASLSTLYTGLGGGPTLTWSSFPRAGENALRGVDPRGGAMLALRYQLRQSRVWDPLTGGMLLQDGELLGTYLFHRVDAELRQALALPMGGQTFEWRLNLGYINRNVAWWDELRAGSRLAGLEPPLDPFVPFAGYTSNSLSGETLGVLSLAWRAPLLSRAARAWGPLYLDRLYGQLGATLGNVWGYEATAGDPSRESVGSPALRNTGADGGLPFVTELGLEVRMQASLFNRYRWASFLHLGYAFQSVTGLGDVNRDGVYPGSWGDLVPMAGGEVYPAGIRLNLGLGTGF